MNAKRFDQITPKTKTVGVRGHGKILRFSSWMDKLRNGRAALLLHDRQHSTAIRSITLYTTSDAPPEGGHRASKNCHSPCCLVDYIPRSTLYSRKSLAGNGVANFQTMLIGRSPSTDSSVTGPQARYASLGRGRTKSWNVHPLLELSR